MADILLLLSLCIANMPLLTEDLLLVYSISGVFTDIPSWLASQVAQAGARMRHWRLVLVERHRSKATSAFLQELKSRPSHRRDGRVEVVPVYDWRLLEAITEEERRNRRSNNGGTRQTARTGAKGTRFGGGIILGVLMRSGIDRHIRVLYRLLPRTIFFAPIVGRQTW